MGIGKDLKLTLRGLRKNPVITGAAVLSLALGLGANTAIFSLLDALFLRPPSVEEPERLVSVHHKGLEGHGTSSNYADYLDLQRDADAFSGLVAESRRGGLLKVDDIAELVTITVVSDNYFPVLGVNMVLGRAFNAQIDAELTGEPPLVIGHQLWRRRFGSDPGILGSAIILNDRHYTVVGVVTPTFRGFNRMLANDVWMPPQSWAAMSDGNRSEIEGRGARSFHLTGRLAPGAGLEQAQAQLDTIARRLAEAYPATNRGHTFVAEMMHAENVRRGMRLSVLLLPVVGLVLLIACVNVANLLLAKAEVRRRVTVIQLALGATRGSLIRQFLTESALLAIFGLVSGVLLANWLLSLAPAMMPPSPIPLAFDIRLDARVLAYTAGLSLLTVFLFGLAPALRASKPDLSSTLKGEELQVGRGRTRLSLRNMLVA
ncbi:MAG: FtsX-like permease family protein, partial [bacterium]|nr:FtsX-like permease family protein [bacterium]